MTNSWRSRRAYRPFPVHGASVAITGGAGGIGRATAERFLAAGARVTIGDIDADAAQRTAAELGHGTIGVGLDVSDETSFAAFLDTVEAAHGPLDVLINNAGIDWMGRFHTGTNDHARREVAVNLMGPIIGSRLAMERMLPRQHGHLVNVASSAGRVPQPGSAVYTATKHGVVGLTESLRLEYRNSGVRFSILHPGYIPTVMTAGTRRPSRLMPTATPEDCARGVLEAVQHNRFEIWSPSGQWVGIKLGHLVGRSIRERVLLALGIDKIADDLDPSARNRYHERAFGAPRQSASSPVSAVIETDQSLTDTP